MAEEKTYGGAVFRPAADKKDPPPDTEKLKAKLSRKALIAPVMSIVVMILMFVTRAADSSLYSMRDNIYLSVIILQLMVFALPGIFMLRLKGTGAVMKLNFRILKVKHIRFIVYSAFTLIGSAILMKTAMYRLGVYSGEFTFFGRFVPYGSIRTDFSGIAYLIIAFAVVPTFVEEFVYRCLIFCEYRDLAGGVLTALVTSLMYSLLSYSFTQLPLYFMVGMILCFVVSVTGSVWAAMIVRFAYSLLSLLFEYNLSTLLRTSGSLVFPTFVTAALTAVFFCLALSQAERFYGEYAAEGRKKPDFTALSFGRRAFVTGFSPTLMICVVIFAAGVIIASRWSI